MNRASLVWTLLAAAALAAVTTAADLADDKPADKSNEPGKQFHEQLLDIAKSYQCVGPVDFETRWAPERCRAPVPYKDYTPAVPRMSDSKDSGTHGRKLYFLFAKDRLGYLRLGKESSDREKTDQATRDLAGTRSEVHRPQALPEKLKALQQFIVKQSWEPVEIDKDKRKPLQQFESIDPYATKDGKTYKTGKQGDLFIMFKLDPKTSATDNGWVYGTVSADAKKVTSAGRVDSCMSCHKDAKHDRLFGLAKPETAEKTEKDKK
jgi:hypothetical protein